MATLTGIVATVVLHVSAAAFSHFGLSLPLPEAKPTAMRTIARSHPAAQKIACPTEQAQPQVHQKKV